MKSGFVNIIGKPNVGKSTLMNALVGEKMSIITHKPQTTRHRIIGLVNGEDHQIVFSDTPGFVHNPSYKMHERMNEFVRGTFEDGDILLFITDTIEKYPEDHPIIDKIKNAKMPKFLVINKVDLVDRAKVAQMIIKWNSLVNFDETFPVSALKKFNTKPILDTILKYLPEGPVYYPQDQLSDKNERFFVSEIIREKILVFYKEEIPYSVEVIVDRFKEDKEGNMVRIHANIYVNRKTQKSILIGNQGKAIKRLGIEARKDIEKFLQKRVFLELYVKIKDNWRDDDKLLRQFGYQ